MRRRTVSGWAWVAVAALCGLGYAVGAGAAGEPRARRADDSARESALPSVVSPTGFADSIANVLGPRSPTPVPAPLPPLPQEPGPPEPIRRKTLAYDLVRAGQDLFIREDEIVRGDVILLGGDLRVDGEIRSSAVVVGGRIDLGPRSRVDGEVVALGGRVETAPGAAVRGGVVGLSLFPRPQAGGVDWRRARDLGTLAGNAIGGALVLAWTVTVTLVIRRRLARARSWLVTAPWRTTGLGVVGMTGGLFAVVMGIVLLAITLVGLPVALLVALFTIVLLFVAQAIGLVHFGGWICGLLRLHVRSPFALGLIGVVVVAAPQVTADLSRLSGRGPVALLQATHALLVAVTLAAGIGALVLSRLGRHPAPSALPAVASGFPPPAAPAPLPGQRS
jgi:hypothetical protein